MDLAAAAAIVGSYLLGSISFGLVLAWLRGVDLRSIGSGNVGATNAARALGRRWGVVVMALDAAKATVPILLVGYFFAARPEHLWLQVAAAAAAFVGHLFPVFHGFRGGKGVATAFGAFLALCPLPAALAFATYAILVLVTRISSVGSLGAVLTFPLWLYLTHAQAPLYWLTAGLAVGILIKHRGNVSRLLQRREQRV